jgi:DNA topoisomerase-1
MVAATDPVDAAAQVGLVHVCDEAPGLVRRRRGKGFSYHRADGSPVSPSERERIEALVIPPAWTDVWICRDPNGHLQATGRDEKGRKQYRYHDLWREVRDEDKFAGLAAFGRCLPRLRSRVDQDLSLRGWPIERTCALAVRLLDLTLLRIGGVQYAAENESYGLTTLLSDHVSFERGVVQLCFPGKHGVEQTVRVADETSRRLLRDCLKLGGDCVLSHRSAVGVQSLRADDVNEYLRDRGGPEITAKDFRTWGASVIVTEVLAPLDPPEDDKLASAAVAEAEKVASEVLGNTVAVARSAYIHPGLAESLATGDLREHWRRSRSGPRLSRAERCLIRFLSA